MPATRRAAAAALLLVVALLVAACKVQRTEVTLHECRQCCIEISRSTRTVTLSRSEVETFEPTVHDRSGLCAECARPPVILPEADPADEVSPDYEGNSQTIWLAWPNSEKKPVVTLTRGLYQSATISLLCSESPGRKGTTPWPSGCSTTFRPSS